MFICGRRCGMRNVDPGRLSDAKRHLSREVSEYVQPNLLGRYPEKCSFAALTEDEEQQTNLAGNRTPAKQIYVLPA